MTKGERNRLVWMVSIVSIVWLVLAGVILFVFWDVETANHASSGVKDRMAAECFGTFRDRYECKEAIIVQSGRDTFWAMAWRFLLTIVPPLALNFWLSSYLRKHPVQIVEHRFSDPGDDWKNRARLHTQTQSPEQTAHDLHLDNLPHKQSHSHPIEDIAPVEDWKSRDKSQINKAKRPE